MDIKGLLSLDDVDHILSTMALRAPAFRVIKGGATLPQSSYTRRARIGSRTITDLIDVARVHDHFAAGATIVLQGLHRYWPPVTDLCRGLEGELTNAVQANAYITPPVAQGLRVHADSHDVFAVQTHGRKQWVLYEGDQQPAPDGTGGTPTLDTQLQPGDCLYLPRGVHHAARTVDSPSIHLTLGVKAVTWAEAFRRHLDAVFDDPSLQESLPAGFADAGDALHDEAHRRGRLLAERIAQQLDDVHALAAVSAAAERFRVGRTASRRGQLAQILLAGSLDAATVVQVRPDAFPSLTRDGNRVTVHLGDRALRLPGHVEEPLTALLTIPRIAVRDLPGTLDEAGRLTLVRRLIREGVLTVVDG